MEMLDEDLRITSMCISTDFYITIVHVPSGLSICGSGKSPHKLKKELKEKLARWLI